jgi:DNA invertase Pin-like site-specific DNA recombinase
MIETAIYARVSTDKQATDTQIKDLRDFASALGHEIVAEYTDMMSGGNPARPEFKRLLDDADAHKFDMILIWALDRFSREGILATLSYLNRLRRANIALKSLKESWLDTSDAGIGQLLLHKRRYSHLFMGCGARAQAHLRARQGRDKAKAKKTARP